jgi:hypothetical protein
MSGGDKKTYKLSFCERRQLDDVAYLRWDVSMTKGNPCFQQLGPKHTVIRYAKQILSVQFNVSLVIAVFISEGGMSTSVRFLDFIM